MYMNMGLDMKGFPELEPITLNGVFSGLVLMTPREIQTPHNPHFWETRATIKVILDMGAETIYMAKWSKNNQVDRLGVYKAGLLFPDKCPMSLSPVEKQEMMEVAVNARPLGKVTFNGSAEQNQRVVTALTSERFWFKIPFSAKYGIKSRAVGFTTYIKKKGRWTAIVLFRNREYAREFVALNRLEGGRWLALKHLAMRIIGTIAGLFGIGGLGGYLLAANSENATITLNPLVVVLAGLVGVAGIALFFISNRGEAL